MSRTIIYPPAGQTTPPTAPPAPDKYLEKLAKYIPGEATAFYVTAYPLAKGLIAQEIVLAVGVAVAILVYLAGANRAQLPRWWFWLLAPASFFAWAIGTSSVEKDLFGLEESVGQVALLAAALIIPLFDEAFTKWLPGWLQWP